MRVLVTGGAGYIGSVATERLLGEGHEPVVLDSLINGHRGAVPEGAELVEGDLRDADRLRAVVSESRVEAVLHFAALTLVGESVEKPGDYFGVNVGGGHSLIEAMRLAGVDRLVFSSTAAVYGMPASLPIREDAATDPINPYGRSKLMVEQMLPWHAQAWGLKYACLRYFNVAGASSTRGEDHAPETHVIPVALLTLLGKREQFSVFGTDYPTEDGTAIRDYVHVLDLVDAHIAALTRLSTGDAPLGAINLGTRDGFSVRQVIEAVERVTGQTLPVSYGPRRAGDPPALVADASRAREVLGWEPSRSTLDDMVTSAWAWHRSRPDGYADR